MRKKYEGKTCPFCHTPIGPDDVIAVCDTCDMPHHLSCWQENMSCTTFGCTGRIKEILMPETANAPAAEAAPAMPATQVTPAAPAQPQPAAPTAPAPQPAAQRFETVYQSEHISVQQDAAVYVDSISILRGNVTGELFARCTFQSTTDASIAAILVDLQCKDVWGNEVQGITGYQYLDLKTKRGAPFGQTAPVALPDINTRSVTVLIRKISYADGRVEQCQAPAQNFPKAVMLEAHLGSADLAQEFVRQTNAKAKFAPVSQHGLWRCACGAMSTESEETCRVCSSQAAVLLPLLNRDQLEADMLAFRQAEAERIAKERAEREARIAKAKAEEEERIRKAEEAARLEKEKRDAELALQRKKKRKKRRTIVAIISTIVVLCLLVFLVIPYGLFMYADSQLAAGEYDAAYELFVTLRGFNGSNEKALQSHYQKAAHLLENGQYDEASALYLSLGDYADSAVLAQEALYQKAEKLLNEEQYAEALSVYLSLGTYADSTAKAQEAQFLMENVENERQYKAAVALLAEGKLDEALEAFTALGNYKDSRDQAKQCQYQQADILLSEGKYDEAASLFASLGDFKDAPDKAKEAQYCKAVILLNAGDYTAASNIFNSISDYKDSATLALDANYRTAKDLYDQGKYKEAAERFSVLGNYQDAATMAKKASYKYGNELLKDKKYEEAVEVFTALGSYEDSKTKVKEAKYEIASAALKKGKYEEAATKFAELGSYKDAKDKANEANYLNAKDKAKNGKYADAYKLYSNLGSYSDSKSKLDALVKDWAVYILNNNNKSQAETFKKTVKLTSDQQTYVYNQIIDKINANESYSYWDDWYNSTSRSATVYNLLQSMSSSYRDTSNLMKLFKAFIDGDTYPASTYISKNMSFLEKMWDYGFVRDYLSSDYAISDFMIGRWETSDGTNYVEFYYSSSGGVSCSYKLPTPTKPSSFSHYDIEDGIYYWEDSNNNHLAKVFRFEFVSFNKMKVYCYQDGKTYTLYRE